MSKINTSRNVGTVSKKLHSDRFTTRRVTSGLGTTGVGPGAKRMEVKPAN